MSGVECPFVNQNYRVKFTWESLLFCSIKISSLLKLQKFWNFRNIRVLQMIRKEVKLLFTNLPFPCWTLFFLFCRQLNDFLKKLRKEYHWLRSMSETLYVRCTVCIGEETEPCTWHEKRSCRHHDCGHYISLDSNVLCCKPGEMLRMKPLEPWIKARKSMSKVDHVKLYINPLSPNIQKQILQTDLHTFL